MYHEKTQVSDIQNNIFFEDKKKNNKRHETTRYNTYFWDFTYKNFIVMWTHVHIIIHDEICKKGSLYLLIIYLMQTSYWQTWRRS